MKELGIVTMIYDAEGNIVSSDFTATMSVSAVDENLLRQLKTIKSGESAKHVQDNADLMLGAWFSKLTDIELTEPSEGKIVSEIVECTKHDNGAVNRCVIKYIFQTI